MGTCFYSSTRHSQAKCQKQDCLYKHVSFILSVRTQHTPTHPSTPQHTPHSPMPIHPQVSECLSLRINWRASVNLLIDQVSALVPTLFFVIVTLHLRRSLHPPFRHGHLFYSSTRHSQAKCQKQDCLYKHVSFILSIVIRRTQHTLTHPNTPHTLPCLYILKYLSVCHSESIGEPV